MVIYKWLLSEQIRDIFYRNFTVVCSSSNVIKLFSFIGKQYVIKLAMVAFFENFNSLVKMGYLVLISPVLDHQ